MIMLLKFFLLEVKRARKGQNAVAAHAFTQKVEMFFLRRGFTRLRFWTDLRSSIHHLLVGEEASEQCARYQAYHKKPRHVSGKYAVQKLATLRM